MFEQIEGVKINEEEESGAMLAFQELWWLAQRNKVNDVKLVFCGAVRCNFDVEAE